MKRLLILIISRVSLADALCIGENMHYAVTYRGYQISRALDSLMPQTDWHYGHVDFDGPEDNRYGYASGVDECKAAIDDRLDN